MQEQRQQVALVLLVWGEQGGGGTKEEHWLLLTTRRINRAMLRQHPKLMLGRPRQRGPANPVISSLNYFVNSTATRGKQREEFCTAPYSSSFEEDDAVCVCVEPASDSPMANV